MQGVFSALPRVCASSVTPSLTITPTLPHRRFSSPAATASASGSAAPPSAYEDQSERLHTLKEAVILPDRPGFVIPTYQILSNDGKLLNKKEYPSELDQATVMKLFEGMIQMNELDKIMYDIQRQGMISFYMTAFGEEATHFGSAQALTNDDVIYAQYREAGVIYHRGFTLDQIIHQCFSTTKDLGKGRQMPVHYGSKELNFHTISSPLGTQIPQATGAAYSLKLTGKKNIAMCYFGDGAASEGDFHPALNFASTLSAPVVFFCRNNKWAISTPSSEQYRGDGIAGRAVAYGMHVIRCDGNDLFAVYNATKEAKRIAVEESRPVLIEAMTYRVGHHSTSDDFTRYRKMKEVNDWTIGNNPITRLSNYVIAQKYTTEKEIEQLRKESRNRVLASMKEAERAKKPHQSHLFSDVYDEMPLNLREQKAELEAHLAKHGAAYKLDEYDEEV
eukprot:TRINITY_DN3751_c0_g1_i1.p1 TRINITY_DN3751_c0_g1~~TRINITY_DN3751_c0_g1_i1.p1  ORF type:complete len:447 (+),score=138.86 TRINITY_DN3751_c0_g1_i1:557-1897(+)